MKGKGLNRLGPRIVFLGIISALLFAASPDGVGQDENEGGLIRGRDFAAGRIIVAFQTAEGRRSSDFASFVERWSAEERQKLLGHETYLYTLPDHVDVKEAAAGASRLAEVRYAEPEFIFRLPGAAPSTEPYYALRKFPNDPLFPLQWPLHNTGQLDGTPDADIDAPEGWAISTDGSGVIVAVSDTGVDYTHPDLRDNLWVNEIEYYGLPDVDDDGNSYVDDIYGFDFVHGQQQGGIWREVGESDGPFDDLYHGTASCGTIGAVTDNLEGMAGVAWTARIMNVKCMDHTGSGWSIDIRYSVHYAVDNGAQVINCSWISPGASYYIREGIEYARDHGVLCIVAAGNSSTNIDEDPSQFGYPAYYDYVNMVAVAATDMDDHLVGKGPKHFNWGTNWGPVSVDVAAPGVCGITTEPLWRENGGYRDTWSGTSMAMPHVVGMAAMAWTQDLGQTYEQVRDRILWAVDGKSQLDGYILTGGRVNLHHLLRTDGGPPAPVTDLSAAPLWFDRLRLSWTETADDGAVGFPASLYDLRYSTEPVTPLNFDDATVVIGEYQPVNPGAFATSVVEGLEEDTLYYFLMKIKDHHGNEVFSNPTSAVTPLRPVVDDLAVVSEGVGYVDLAFTVPAVSGTTTKYNYPGIDVRYDPEPIDEESFDDAAPAENLPPVGKPGTTMTVRVEPLYPGSAYWFAVRLTDSFGRETPVSNTVEGASLLPATVAFFDDMESGPGGWYVEPAGAWGLTDETAASGAWSWNTFPYAHYPPDWEGSLWSPSVDLSNVNWGCLFFKDVLDYHIGETVQVEASLDGGAHWTLLDERRNLSDFHLGWETYYVNLSLFAGQSDVRLRFRLLSDSTYEEDGWYIDDVLVGGEVVTSMTLVDEDFEGSAPGWSFGDLWTIDKEDYHSWTHAAHFHSENDPTLSFLETDPLAPGFLGGRLYFTFWHKYRVNPQGGMPRVLVSTDGGGSWTPVWPTFTLRDDDQWTFRGVDLTEKLGATPNNIMVRFSCRGTDTNTVDWFVDDVRLFVVQEP